MDLSGNSFFIEVAFISGIATGERDLGPQLGLIGAEAPPILPETLESCCRLEEEEEKEPLCLPPSKASECALLRPA